MLYKNTCKYTQGQAYTHTHKHTHVYTKMVKPRDLPDNAQEEEDDDKRMNIVTRKPKKSNQKSRQKKQTGEVLWKTRQKEREILFKNHLV